MSRFKRSCGVLTMLLCSLPGSASAVQKRPDRFVIRNVHVVPMDGARVLHDASVVLEDGVVTAILRSGSLELPGDARIIEGRDGFLIPGLWDMHVHIRDASDASMLLAHGVTGAREMFGSRAHLELRERIRAGEIPGPELVVAGPIIEGEPPPELASVIATEGE